MYIQTPFDSATDDVSEEAMVHLTQKVERSAEAMSSTEETASGPIPQAQATKDRITSEVGIFFLKLTVY